MAGFLVFSSDDQFHPDSLGVKGAVWSHQTSERGPNKQPGKLWYQSQVAPDKYPHLQFSPDDQRWLPGIGGDGEWWVGWSTANPVKPQDLQRPDPVDGMWLTLNDSNRWNMPSGFSMPYNFGLTKNGELSETIKPEFVPFYDAAVKNFELAKQLIEDDNPIDETNRTQVAKFVSYMLGVNYFLTFEIAVLIGLFDPITLWQGLCVATDAKTINQLLSELEKGG